MSAPNQATIRLRKRKSKEEPAVHSDATVENAAREEDVVWGKTPGGEGERVVSYTVNTLTADIT